MIELILSTCLVADPVRCKDVTLSFAEAAVTPHACMLYGQSEIAKWMEGHPNWSVTHWRCGRVDRTVARI